MSPVPSGLAGFLLSRDRAAKEDAAEMQAELTAQQFQAQRQEKAATAAFR